MTNRECSSKALIFNMINGSFVDGYGIRTTIFLKGCPLRCTWCCNPDGQQFSPQLNYEAGDCNGCHGKYRCMEVCPRDAISKTDDGRIRIDRRKCTDCLVCTKKCFFDALTVSGTEYTAFEIFEKVKREKPYFDQSGGGLTIGGGEATCFPEFCLELIRLCHEAGISVAIDTCGYMTKPDSIRVLLEADLILLDIKGLNEQEHIRNTGVSNKGIWDTLGVLRESHKPVIIRVPMIPEYNYHMEQYPEMADRLSRYENIERVDILPFHEYGKRKYETLGMKYEVHSHKILIEEQEKIQKIFENHGLQTQIGG